MLMNRLNSDARSAMLEHARLMDRYPWASGSTGTEGPAWVMAATQRTYTALHDSENPTFEHRAGAEWVKSKRRFLRDVAALHSHGGQLFGNIFDLPANVALNVADGEWDPESSHPDMVAKVAQNMVAPQLANLFKFIFSSKRSSRTMGT